MPGLPDYIPHWATALYAVAAALFLFHAFRAVLPIKKLRRNALLNRKPFTCDTCMSFWCAVAASIAVHEAVRTLYQWPYLCFSSMVHETLLISVSAGILMWMNREPPPRVDPSEYIGSDDLPPVAADDPPEDPPGNSPANQDQTPVT
jgi:hypothetical protein